MPDGRRKLRRMRHRKHLIAEPIGEVRRQCSESGALATAEASEGSAAGSQNDRLWNRALHKSQLF